MNYEDEKWIKVYTRDTAAWLALPWQARGLMLEIARKIPALTGELSLGRKGLPTIAALLRAPWEEIEGYVRELIADGRLEYHEDRQILFDPQHVERQTAIASTAKRAQDYRERARIAKAPKQVRRKTVEPPVTQRHASVTERHAESLLDKIRSDQTRPDESENARAQGVGSDESVQPGFPLADDGLVHGDLPLLDDARAKYESYTMNRRLDTSVEDCWIAFVGQYPGQRFGSRSGILGKFAQWLTKQFKIDEKARAERRSREERDATFAARFPPKSDVAPMKPYAPAVELPETSEAEQRETQRLAAQRGLSFLDFPDNDAPKTGTDE